MKKFIAILLAGIMIFACAGTCMAKEINFKKKVVDSNVWTYVCTGQKDTTTSTADLRVTNIYKADGSKSLYSKVKAKVYQGSSVTVSKGVYTSLAIPSSRRAKGKYVPLYAMGNNPKLDCKISGSWVVH